MALKGIQTNKQESLLKTKKDKPQTNGKHKIRKIITKTKEHTHTRTHTCTESNRPKKIKYKWVSQERNKGNKGNKTNKQNKQTKETKMISTNYKQNYSPSQSPLPVHVSPWLIHVNVWQKPLQYCKVISLQLVKINEKQKVTKTQTGKQN